MSYLTQDYRRTRIRTPKPLLTGLDAQLHAYAGKYQRNPGKLEALIHLAEEADGHAAHYKAMRDKLLKKTLADFKQVFCRCAKGYETQIPEALAAIREAAWRCLGMRPYIVQLAGATALYQGYLAEMATGEGKTLTAALTAVLHGWRGLPCHIVTVNDYLAARDAKALAEFYRFCHVSVGHVIGAMEPPQRKKGYDSDITYTTSKEIVADFLRDRLWLRQSQHAVRRHIKTLLQGRSNIDRGLVMRGLYAAIVDEADSVLIDEAVTPLIISKSHPNEPFLEACQQANMIAEDLQADIDYEIKDKYKEIRLHEETETRLRELLKEEQYRGHSSSQQLELIRQALTAREFFKRDQQYVIKDDKILIVDEFTGRLMPQRHWQAGLHQLVEAKEKVPLSPPGETLARLSFQRFFRFFYKLSGMTGTAKEAAGEFWHIYQLPVVSIPENRSCQRIMYPTQVYANQKDKWQAIVEEIKETHKQGRPVLIGTRSVKASEALASKLIAAGLVFRLLNAHRHKEEAEIVARAGQAGTITIATNMAGRGTDIVLEKGVDRLGGLHVIGTECHESGRIDRQLFGRCARQGDPGSARLFVSMEDELLCRYLPKVTRQLIKASLKEQYKGSEWSAIRLVKWAQANAQRLAYRRRRTVLRTDTWLNDSLSFAPGEDSVL